MARILPSCVIQADTSEHHSNIPSEVWRLNENEESVAQSCPTLADPVACSPPGSSVHGILQARRLEWVAILSSPGALPPQGSNPGLPHCRQILNQLSHQGSP